MWALIDCNSFFCSVEKVFHLGLKNKPVVVLSNNDGCIVALTPESKKLGLHRGDPIFKVRSIVDANHVAVFSTNMTLYAAMSRRVTNIMRKSVLHVENYSIDESFCDLQGYEKHYGLTGYMHSVTDKIQLYTDIPVSVGIALSKTIAKMGSKFAKNYKGYKGMCAIDTDEKRRKALELFPLDDVENIGCMPTLVEKRTLIYERLYNVAAQIKDVPFEPVDSADPSPNGDSPDSNPDGGPAASSASPSSGIPSEGSPKASPEGSDAGSSSNHPHCSARGSVGHTSSVNPSE